MVQDVLDKFWSTGGYWTPPGSYWVSLALVEKREGWPGGGARPLAPILIGQGEGAAPREGVVD